MEDGHLIIEPIDRELKSGLFCIFDEHGGNEAMFFCKQELYGIFLEQT